jgi:4'-phosphopantetheinyl transferase
MMRAEDLAQISVPDDNSVHVWRVSVAGTSITAMTALLDGDEQARASRFVFSKDREQFVAARGWLRTFLGAYLSCDPRNVRFAYGAQGKPVCAAPVSVVDLRFNVSHSGDVVLLAFARGRDVGVDVEEVSARIDPIELGRTCFSDTEQAVVREVENSERLGVFFRFWTAKEAYIKLLGGGLSIPLGNFTVEASDSAPVWQVLAVSELCHRVTVRPVAVPEGYRAAVAMNGSGWSMMVRSVIE